VVAHDLGGNMAVKLVADHPDVVGRLVLVATPANDDQIDLPTPLWLATLPVVGSIFYALGRLARPVRALWMRPFVLDPKDLSEEVVEDAARSTAAAVGGTLSVARREISRGRLARQARIIKIPMLLIAGEEDQIVDPQAVGAWARSVDQAEVCLLDECGHLPMIERTVEFNAQILAFLTGDARYLDYAETASVPDEEDFEYDEAAEIGSPEEGEEVAPPASPAGPPHGTPQETTDLAPRHATSDDDEIEGHAPTPNVIRRQGDRYPARNQEAEPEHPDPPSADGTEDDRSRAERTPSDDDAIPELPEDLFDWPDARNEFRPREWPRTGPSGERADGSDEPENPSRS
jgi:predicted alpha/beta hydrolase family esterase